MSVDPFNTQRPTKGLSSNILSFRCRVLLILLSTASREESCLSLLEAILLQSGTAAGTAELGLARMSWHNPESSADHSLDKFNVIVHLRIPSGTLKLSVYHASTRKGISKYAALAQIRGNVSAIVR